MTKQIENRMVTECDYYVRKVICLCEQCGGNIYEQDDFYDFSGEIVCEGCINDYISDHRR